MPYLFNRAEQLSHEQALLVKAEDDIEQGRSRLRDQERMVSEMQETGHDTREAERLAQLLKRILVEWERHRVLIVQRIAYLKEISSP